MCETLVGHKGSVRIGGRLILFTKCSFADDSVVNAEEAEEAYNYDQVLDMDITYTR